MHLVSHEEYTIRYHQLHAGGKGCTPCTPLYLWSPLNYPSKNRWRSEAHCRRVYLMSTGCRVCKQQCEAGHGGLPGTPPIRLWHPLGAEAAVHVSHIYLWNMKEHHLLLKLDFKNAFNCLRQDKMLAAVSEKAPDLFPLIHSAYGTPSSLFIGDSIIQSAKGVQQGNPLGPLFFVSLPWGSWSN